MIPKSNEIVGKQIADISVWWIKGDVTRLSRSIFNEVHETAVPQSQRKILLVFHEDTYFNSEGLKVILDLFTARDADQRKFGIVGLSSHFKKIFGMVGITSFATIYDSVDEGVSGLREI